MRLFKGQNFFLHRGGPARSGKAGAAEESFGSEISTKEQFDIIIPIKTSRTNRSWGGFLEKDDTTVSSITTTPDIYHPHHSSTRTNYLAKHQQNESGAGKTASSWCCCAPMQEPVEQDTTSPTMIGTENTVVPGEADDPAGAGAFLPTAATPTPESAPPLARQNAWCCSSDNVHDSSTSLDDRGGAAHRGGIAASRSICSFNRNNSLFDVLAEEDDLRANTADGAPAATMRHKLRHSLRRALPWPRPRSFKTSRRSGCNTAGGILSDAAAAPTPPEYYTRSAE